MEAKPANSPFAGSNDVTACHKAIRASCSHSSTLEFGIEKLLPIFRARSKCDSKRASGVGAFMQRCFVVHKVPIVRRSSRMLAPAGSDVFLESRLEEKSAFIKCEKSGGSHDVLKIRGCGVLPPIRTRRTFATDTHARGVSGPIHTRKRRLAYDTRKEGKTGPI